MQRRILAGTLLLFLGYLASQKGTKPWDDFDFIFVWYGIILLVDTFALILGSPSVFSVFRNLRSFILLGLASSGFWWFYEWTNIFLQNWAYPYLYQYNQIEFGVFATLAFTTVIPLLAVSSNFVFALFVKSGLLKHPLRSKGKSLSQPLVSLFVVAGLLSLSLSLSLPPLFFPLVWLSLFLILDPINALGRRESLVGQLLSGKNQTIILLALGGIFAGLLWETVNAFLANWTYPISPFFWQLPKPLTIKIFEMPLLGYLGYIPFAWSAYSFVKFLDIKTPWLSEK